MKKIMNNLIVFIAVFALGNNVFAQGFEGKYQLDMQHITIHKVGSNQFKVTFSGDCEFSKTGKVNKKGVLVLKFAGENQMQKMMIRRKEGNIKIKNSSNSPIMQLCNGGSLVGTYYRRGGSSSGNYSNTYDKNLAGTYQLDMMYVKIRDNGSNRFSVTFSGDCELTKDGRMNENGELVINFNGENQVQRMYIRKRGNQITIKNTDNSPMMQLCNGATLAGTYMKR